MARKIDDIFAQMVAEKNAQTELNSMDSPSQVAKWNLFLYVVAVCIAIHEQIIDIRNAAVELLVRSAAPSTNDFIKWRVLNLFQYDAITPQVVILNSSLAPTYAVIDATKRIVTRCAVHTPIPGFIDVKVAKGTTSIGPLSGAEISALDSFLNYVTPAGVSKINVISVDSDKIYVEADITINGQYDPTIRATVKTALNNFYAALSSDVNFNGVLRVSDVEKTIKGVEGVIDVIIKKVYVREDTAVFANGTKVMDLSLALNQGAYEMYAGYGVEETTTGKTLDSSLNFIIG